ncbi:hypothetical protein IT417_03545 [bacterium]|nr:hypothetical protein [bacterium]
MKINWSKYTSIEQLRDNIKSVKIQGATNVALAVVRGMEVFIESFKGESSQLAGEVVKVGKMLANARHNEPMARNAVRFLEKKLEEKFSSTGGRVDAIAVSQINSEYLNLVERMKDGVLKSSEGLGPVKYAFTHCHSSTVERILKNLSEKNTGFKVACSETRPLFQGRITAANLSNQGVDTTLVVDSGAPNFAADRSFFPIDVLLIGADEITADGGVINKIGSYGIAVAAKSSGTPVYVVASLLKVNPEMTSNNVQIEMREPSEVWEDAPKDIKIYNPAFELVNKELITGYITESGIVKPEDVLSKLHETYPWAY